MYECFHRGATFATSGVIAVTHNLIKYRSANKCNIGGRLKNDINYGRPSVAKLTIGLTEFTLNLGYRPYIVKKSEILSA